MARNDYRCMNCGEIVESFYGEPCESCPSCDNKGSWEVVFTTVPQVCFNNASVLEKIDEVNGKLRKETMEESYDPEIGW